MKEMIGWILVSIGYGTLLCNLIFWIIGILPFGLLPLPLEMIGFFSLFTGIGLTGNRLSLRFFLTLLILSAALDPIIWVYLKKWTFQVEFWIDSGLISFFVIGISLLGYLLGKKMSD